jgi:RNA polymerase sigma-70 factor (ECF subfamily)
MLPSAENIEATYRRLTDEQLVERLKNGDRKSLDVLVRAYLPRAYSKVCSLVPESDAEDVRQEIFLSLVNSIDNFKGRSSFATWFHRITMNRIADYYREASRRKEKSTEEQPSEADDPWRKTDEELTVREALTGMPEKYKEVLLLRYSQGLSLGEISKKLGVTYEATRSRCRRGVDMLKEKMKEI